MALRHPVGPGAPLPIADLSRPFTVQKGEAVQMQLDTPGISLSAQGIAMDNGATGERVRVLNVQSRAIVEAEVSGSGAGAGERDGAGAVGAGRTGAGAGGGR